MFTMVFMTVIFSTTSPEGDIEFYPETSFPTYETEAKCHAALLQLAAEHELEITQTKENELDIRDLLINLSASDFFNYYANRPSNEELPLLNADGIVIPKIGLRKALSIKEHVNSVPTIAGSNRDEVKLWLASAEYFVDLDY